jgi:hypothetical protein
MVALISTAKKSMAHWSFAIGARQLPENYRIFYFKGRFHTAISIRFKRLEFSANIQEAGSVTRQSQAIETVTIGRRTSRSHH